MQSEAHHLELKRIGSKILIAVGGGLREENANESEDSEGNGKGFLAQDAYVQIPFLNFLCYRFKHINRGYVAVHARGVGHGFN